MVKLSLSIMIISTFLWVGFVGAISFMEAWLKFRAPGVTLPLGLGIGRIVFGALNKVEWVLSLFIICGFFIVETKYINLQNVFIIVPVLILVVQSWYALPELDCRAEMHIRGWPVEPSNLHTQYIIMEFIKVFSLLVYGISLIFNRI